MKANNDTKSKIKFAIIMACSMLAGGICGAGAVFVGKHPIDMAMISNICVIASPTIFVLETLILFIMSYVTYNKNRVAYKNWDGEDESVLDRIEHSLSFPLMYSNICQALMFILMPATLWASEAATINKRIIAAAAIISIGCLFLSLIWVVAIQNVVVNFIKELNPEKQGSVFDTDFAKKWEGSFDEAQKQEAYKAGYMAYKAMTRACLAMWVVTLLTMFAFGTGIMPCLVVFILFFVGTMKYTITCIKEDKV